MPLFISDEELRLLGGDTAAVAERADAAIRELRRQVDTVRAEADAAAIAAEQTCALLEQRYASLSAEFDRSQAEAAELTAAAERRAAELASSQAEIHQLRIQAIAKDGEVERLKIEISELHKSKCQSLELIEQRDAEIKEKDGIIQSYYNKIVNLAETSAGKEARIQEVEAKFTHCQAICNRITQEKELLEKHNLWLDEELKAKVKNLAELRKTNMDEEARMSGRIAELEREISESSSSLRRSKERISELEKRVSYMEKELCSTKDTAAANEQRLSAELSTVMKLAELHKESSEEWSKKAGELEGVIKALETHLTQVEDEYKEKLEKESLSRRDLEKEAVNLKQKLEKCELDLENTRKSSELSLIPSTNIAADSSDLVETTVRELHISDAVNQNDLMVIPKVPSGVSGTALAASLLRDGWSLAKIYEKYQEATDAFLHERRGRRHAEAVLERVLHEIEEKAELILDERAEHERMVEAYALMDQKLQQALLEHDNFENNIRNLKSELKRRERDHSVAQKEIDDLQKQVAVLLKECQDIQLRCGSSLPNVGHGAFSSSLGNVLSHVEHDIKDTMSFKDINGLVQQNVELKNKVHMLSADLDKKDMELRESFQIELKKITDAAASRVEKVMKKSEEQAIMIESLHRSVAMYRKLCEEQQKARSNVESAPSALQDSSRTDLMVLFEGSQEVSKKAYEQVSERARSLDEELTKLRTELQSLRSERDKAVLEADFARDRLNGFAAELEHQRKESNSASLRNAELMRLVVDYEKRLREYLDSKQALEEKLRKLSMEVSTLKNAKENLEKSEKRALDEVRDLTERVHRLQATIDTIHTTEEVQENARSMERRNHEEHIKRLERDWAELKKELQEQRDHVRVLSLDKKNVFDSCMKQVEDMRKELNNSWKAASDAESRAAIAEAKCSDLEAKLKSRKVISRDGGHEISAASEENDELFQLKEELEKYKEEARANKNYMVQYKGIAHSNEDTLKQLESAHEDYKAETEAGRKALEDEIVKLREKLSEMEKSYVMKCEEAANAIESKEKQVTSLMDEISVLRTEVSQKLPQLEKLEIELASSKSSLDEQYKRWRTAQDNYERQVILQSETIQELTNTSKQLSSLQHEITVLRRTADALKTENDGLRSSGEQEKIGLLKERDDALQKYNELNDQNKILHNQLEALHIRLAEKERNIAGLSSHRTDNSHAEDDLQSVISYLRRSKEIAETEISLLKQEKSRLQIELESALKSAKEAHDLLRSQADSARALMMKDEEFKSLQIQVREINLLRESNIQLREENRHNFEECQKFREEAQNAKMESERCRNLLLEKQLDAEMCRRELEMQKAEIANLNQRISELIENSKGIDLNTYEAMKNELQNIKSTLRENSMELESAKKLVSEKEVVIKNLEDKLSVCQSELDSKEKKLNDVEASLKSEIDKHKKFNVNLKRKIDNLMKEKGEIAKENQSLVKQMEDLKSSQKTTSETTLEQAIKEKDFRIQTLERTLEKERDDNKKEKAKSRRNENTIFGALQKVQQDKKQVEESIEKHKQAVKELIENYPGLSSEVPPVSALEEQFLSYFRAAKDMEESSSPFRDGAATQTPVVETVPVDASTSAAGRPVDTPPRPTKAKVMEDRAVLKPSTEVRRPGGRRPLVRPTLPTEEPHADTDTSAVDASTVVPDKGGASVEREASGMLPLLQPSSRKRLISSSQTIDSSSQGEASDANPPSKKPKEEESSQGANELKSGQPPLGDVAAQVGVLPATDDLDGQQPTEEIDTDQVSAPMVEAEATREEDVGDKDDSGDASMDIKGQDADVNIDTNAIPVEDEQVVAKSDAVIESFDDDQKTEDSKEDAQLTAATDVDDDMEEGELAEEPEEKSDVDMSEIEGETTAERAAVEPDQSPITQSGAADASPSRTADASPAREPSPNPVQAGASSRPQNTSTATEARESSSNPAQTGASSEQRNTSTVVEAAETRSRTINLSERARQNRQTRFQRAQQPAAARGRGQQSVTLRKDAAGRGSRGRGGRGQS